MIGLESGALPALGVQFVLRTADDEICQRQQLSTLPSGKWGSLAREMQRFQPLREGVQACSAEQSPRRAIGRPIFAACNDPLEWR